MTLTRDIVIDLLPVYESGEASADTRAAVEAFFAQDAEFARIVKAARRTVPRATEATSPASDAERQAVERTRKALRLKSWTQALAIFFTLLPFIFTFRASTVTFLMLPDHPGMFLICIPAALLLWWSYYRQSQALRKVGWAR